MHTILENVKVNPGVSTASLGGETSETIDTPVYVDMKNYRKCLCTACATTVVNTQVITLQALQATAVGGTSAKVITGKTDTITGTATSTDILSAAVEIDVNDLDLANNFDCVGFRLTTDDVDGAEPIAGHLIQFEPRYADNTMPT